MADPNKILAIYHHRPWPLPTRPWTFYQEWNSTFFLHWRVPVDLIQPMIPRKTALDLFNGEAWISLVAFTLKNIRPRYVPAFPPVSTFYEVNVRTYVTANNKPGIYFLSIEAGKRLSAWISRTVSGLPYEYANMNRKAGSYTSLNRSRNFQLDAKYRIGPPIVERSPLDIFLAERYCLYMERSGDLLRYEVHHKPWDLYNIAFSKLTTGYRIGNISLEQSPHLAHYSDGVQVLTWLPDKVDVL